MRGPAHGLPILLKDLIDVKGMYTSAGNFSLRNSFPETDSGIAKKLRASGVVILGKLGLSEYANSFGNQPSGFSNLTGQVIHGLDADQNPSGSSSGSGTAGTAALSMLIVGTETGGSIISPSQAQSLVGLRPTVGLIPGYGVAPIRLSADTAGPMDRTVANAALTLQSIAGTDPINDAYYREYWGPGIDPATVVPPQPPTVPNYISALDLNFVRGKRIGWNGTSDQVNQAKAALTAAGAILVERPVIDAPADLPALATQGEQHMAIDMYYKRLGASAPIKSLAEEIADNTANSHEALKFGNASHMNAFNVPYGPGTEYTNLFNTNLPIRKAGLQGAINRMMTNDTPADTERRLHRDPRHGPQRRGRGLPAAHDPDGLQHDAPAHAVRVAARQRVLRAQPDRRRVRDRAGHEAAQAGLAAEPEHVPLREDDPGAAVRRRAARATRTTRRRWRWPVRRRCCRSRWRRSRPPRSRSGSPRAR